MTPPSPWGALPAPGGPHPTGGLLEWAPPYLLSPRVRGLGRGGADPGPTRGAPKPRGREPRDCPRGLSPSGGRCPTSPSPHPALRLPRPPRPCTHAGHARPRPPSGPGPTRYQEARGGPQPPEPGPTRGTGGGPFPGPPPPHHGRSLAGRLGATVRRSRGGPRGAARYMEGAGPRWAGHGEAGATPTTPLQAPPLQAPPPVRKSGEARVGNLGWIWGALFAESTGVFAFVWEDPETG